MLSNFIERKLKMAKYKILEDGTYFGAIPSIPGIWANDLKKVNCQKELKEVLKSWLLYQAVV